MLQKMPAIPDKVILEAEEDTLVCGLAIRRALVVQASRPILWVAALMLVSACDVHTGEHG